VVWIFTFGSLVLEQEEIVVFVRRRLSTMSQAKKKNFKIEPFKHKVEMDPKYAEKTWKILEDAIHEIYNHNASGLSFEELYRYEKRERESDRLFCLQLGVSIGGINAVVPSCLRYLFFSCCCFGLDLTCLDVLVFILSFFLEWPNFAGDFVADDDLLDLNPCSSLSWTCWHHCRNCCKAFWL
jgi:hypothetical protein